MGNVLDLKNLRASGGDNGRTTDVESPDEGVIPVELASEDATELEPETESLEAVERPEPLDVEDLAEAALAGAGLPVAMAWEAHHPLQGPARRRHYILLGGLGVLGVLLALWQRNVMPFIVLLIGIVTLELRERWGRPVSVSVDEQGVTVDGQQYAHTAFESFHVHRMPDDTHELSLKAQQKYVPHLRLPLGEQDPYEVHAALMQYIPEGRHKIPLVEYLLRKPR